MHLALVIIFVESRILLADTQSDKGVVVEEIGRGSTLYRAGARVGDVLYFWERVPKPPANPEGAQRRIESVFDWRWLVTEQAPRGSILLSGTRAGEPVSFRVAPGEWESEVRPILPESLLAEYERGRDLIEAGESADAGSVWAQLVADAENAGDWRLPCGLLLRMGDAWIEGKEFKRAEIAYRSALDQSRDDIARAELWGAIGRAQKLAGDFSRAEASHRRASELAETVTPVTLAYAASLRNLGEVAWYEGALDLATEYFERALSIRERLAPRSTEVAAILNNLGSVAGSRGNLASEMRYYKRALAILEEQGSDGLLLGKILNNLGVVSGYRGNPREAVTYHERALEIRERLSPESFGVASSLNNLGAEALIRGDLVEAADYFGRALMVWRKLSPQNVEVAITLNNLGSVASAREDLDQAEAYHRSALEIWENLAPESVEIASSLHNLGALAMKRGDLSQAAEHLERALEIREIHFPDSLDLASILVNLGNVARRRGDFNLAVAYLKRSLAIQEKLVPGGVATASSLNNLGSVALDLGNMSRAVGYFERALAIWEELTPWSLKSAENMNDLGNAFRLRGDLDKAAEYFERSIGILEDHSERVGGSHDIKASVLTRYRSYYRDAIEVHLSRGKLVRAFATLERSRARSFLEMQAERALVFSMDIPHELERKRLQLGLEQDRIQQRWEELSSVRDKEKIKDLQSELRRIQRERDAVIEEIRSSSPELASLQYPRPLGFRGARESLDAGTVMLSYSVGPDTTDLFVIARKGNLRVERLPIGEEELRRNVGGFRDVIPQARPGDEAGSRSGLWSLGNDLYRQLIHPVADTIADSDRVLIIPDGPLHLLPWGALVRETESGERRSWQYLIEWKSLHLALSATVYAQLIEERRRRKRSGKDGPELPLVAFGDPRYPERLRGTSGGRSGVDPHVSSAVDRGFDFSPLPYTRYEVEQILNLYPPGAARIYLGAAATEDRAKTIGRRARILHFAAHGHVDDLLPLNSAVVLAMPEELVDDRDNGLLQVWEIFERVRLDADLVVLSACGSGLGKEQGGEGLIGLTRAFQYAGARSVTASLWSVNDRATAELMIRFYRHMRDGKAKDEALRAAQVELIRGPIEPADPAGRKTPGDCSVPYYWAAFQVYGDWR